MTIQNDKLNKAYILTDYKSFIMSILFILQPKNTIFIDNLFAKASKKEKIYKKKIEMAPFYNENIKFMFDPLLIIIFFIDR